MDRHRVSAAGIVIRVVVAVMLVTAAVLVVMVVLSPGGTGTRGSGRDDRPPEERVTQALKRAEESGVIDDSSEVLDALDELDAADRKTVMSIMANHASEEEIGELLDELEYGDPEELLEYARNNLSLSEQMELLVIAKKYGYW